MTSVDDSGREKALGMSAPNRSDDGLKARLLASVREDPARFVHRFATVLGVILGVGATIALMVGALMAGEPLLLTIGFSLGIGLMLFGFLWTFGLLSRLMIRYVVMTEQERKK
jgi:hypothetical protein